MNSLKCIQRCIFEAKRIPHHTPLSTSTLTHIPRLRLRDTRYLRFKSHYQLLPLSSHTSLKYYSQVTKDDKNQTKNEKEEKVNSNETSGKPPVKLSLFKRFKIMYRDYWYVLVPVHLVTSACWFGGFYYLAKSGVDIVHILESWNVSQRIINPLKDSSMGYLAISYACYKIATPLRYTVTLGGTTISINYLKKWGYIKPVPSTAQLKEIYKDKKENIMETVRETKEIYKERKDNIIETVRETKELYKEKKSNILDSVRDSAKELKLQRDSPKSEKLLSNLEKKVDNLSKNSSSKMENISKKKEG